MCLHLIIKNFVWSDWPTDWLTEKRKPLWLPTYLSVATTCWLNIAVATVLNRVRRLTTRMQLFAAIPSSLTLPVFAPLLVMRTVKWKVSLWAWCWNWVTLHLPSFRYRRVSTVCGLIFCKRVQLQIGFWLASPMHCGSQRFWGLSVLAGHHYLQRFFKLPTKVRYDKLTSHSNKWIDPKDQ